MKVIFRWVQISSSQTGVSLSVGKKLQFNRMVVIVTLFPNIRFYRSSKQRFCTTGISQMLVKSNLRLLNATSSIASLFIYIKLEHKSKESFGFK